MRRFWLLDPPTVVRFFSDGNLVGGRRKGRYNNEGMMRRLWLLDPPTVARCVSYGNLVEVKGGGKVDIIMIGMMRRVWLLDPPTVARFFSRIHWTPCWRGGRRKSRYNDNIDDEKVCLDPIVRGGEKITCAILQIRHKEAKVYM